MGRLWRLDGINRIFSFQFVLPLEAILQKTYIPIKISTQSVSKLYASHGFTVTPSS